MDGNIVRDMDLCKGLDNRDGRMKDECWIIDEILEDFWMSGCKFWQDQH